MTTTHQRLQTSCIMNIEINDQRKISEVQREFNRAFPFLKMEFFEAPHRDKKALPKSKMFAPEKKLGSCRSIHESGMLSIVETETVSALEKTLWENYGLSAQVFRRSGNLWIETSLTDSWSLKRQNDEGREFSHAHVTDDALDLGDRDKWE